MKDLHVILNTIVESIRPTSPIINISVSGTNYVYEALNSLQPLNYVTLTDGTTTWENLQVVSATDSTFTLSEDYAATSYIANAPYFMHEKEPKAFQVLTEKTKQDTFKYQKYPLVLLIRPFDKNNSDMADYECDFRIAIVNSTKDTYWADDRYENNFDPILTPILDDFLDGMIESNNIVIGNKRKIDRTFVDDLYINGNPLPDELDAIIIDFKSIPIIDDSCGVIETATVFDVNTSIVGDGTINSNPLVLTDIKKNTLVSLNATANVNSTFDNWLIGGISYTNRLVSFYVTKTVDAIATFISSLLTIQDVFSTVPTQRTELQPSSIYKSWEFLDQSSTPKKFELNIVCDGNSITEGVTCSPPITYPDLLQDLFEADGYTVTMVNSGKGGTTGQAMVSDYPSEVRPLYDPTKINIYIASEYRNSIVIGGFSYQLTYDQIKNVCNLAKADGFYTIVMTAPRDENYITQMDIINDMLRADNSFADNFFDFASITEYLDPTGIYFCDGTHINDYSFLGNQLHAAISPDIDSIAIDTNNVQVLKQQALKFNGIDTKVPTTIRPTNASILKCRLKFNGTSGTQAFGCYDGTSAFAFGQSGIAGDSLLLYWGTTIGKVALLSNDNLWHDYELSSDGLKVDGVVIITPTNSSEVFTVNKDFYIGFFNNVGGIHSEMDLAYLELDGVVIHTTLGQGSNLVDESTGTLYPITGTIDWTALSDYKTPPYELTLGATLFENNGDQSIASVCYYNGSPSLSSLTGFTKLDDFPAGSGILKGLANTYDGIVYPALVGEKTWQQISDEPTSATLEKPGETANVIPQLIVKE